MLKRYINYIKVLSLVFFSTACEKDNTKPTIIDFTQGKWIDLTHEMSNKMPLNIGFGTFKYADEFDGYLPNGEYMRMRRITTSEHIGTHTDAPNHFAKGKESTEQLNLSRLTGIGAVIDISKKTLNPNYQINIKDILDWENKNNTTINNKIVLFYTGYSNYWGDDKKYFGTEDIMTKNGASSAKFPSIGIELAEWIIKNRKVKSIGLDVTSTDLPNFPTIEESLHKVHIIFANSNIPTFENVANLKEILNKKSVYIIALPIKVKGGTGGPTRIVAFIPYEKN